MFAWNKQLTKEISFAKSLIVILIFFLTSVTIIYYTTVGSQAVVNNYANLIITRSDAVADEGQGLLITRPKPDENVGNHFFIIGRTDSDADNLSYRIINERREVMLRGNIIINQQKILTEVNLDDGNLTPQGTIEFFNNNIGTGKRLLVIPVKFL